MGIFRVLKNTYFFFEISVFKIEKFQDSKIFIGESSRFDDKKFLKDYLGGTAVILQSEVSENSQDMSPGA